MALIDEVQIRIGSQRLIELTRANESAEQVTEGATRLAAAVTDAEAMFRIGAQQTFDVTETRHVALGVRGVVLLLQSWNGESEPIRQALEAWKKDLEALAHTTDRARIMPDGSSDFEDYPSEAGHRSLGDPRNFARLRMRQPGALGSTFEDVSTS